MKTCKYLETTLVFSKNNISPCYSCFQDKTPQYLEEGSIVDFLSRKNDMKKEINSDINDTLPCKNCCHIMDGGNGVHKYNLLVFGFWEEIHPQYNIEEIINNLYKQDLTDKDNLIIEFQSGDIRNFRIFNRLIKIFVENGYKEIKFTLNNVIYHQAIEKILEKNKGSLSFVLDYQDKKDIKYLKKHTRTLKHYIEKAADKNAIKIYYTLDKNNDDKIKNIEQFINQMYITGINYLSLRLHNDNINEWINAPLPLKNCNKNIDKLILHFFKTAKKYCFYSDMSYKEQNMVLRKIFKTRKMLSFKYKMKQFFNGFRRNNEI